MTEQEGEEALLDAATVARWLNVAPATVYEQAARGVLPHIRLWKGARRTLLRFRRSDVEQFIRIRTVSEKVGK
jgi:excisionase family DNA binding protein